MTLSKHLQRLHSVDWIVCIYILITGFFTGLFYDKIPDAAYHIFPRVILLAVILCLPFLDKFIKNNLLKYLRVAYPLMLLGFFYSETDALNNVFFQDLDYHFARADTLIFGFQPSLDFYAYFPQRWFSELMNFSYFSYYFLITAYTIYIFIKVRSDFVRTVFLITSSFLVYYIIFIIIPVSGPQYFFEPPHNQIDDSGIFRTLVKWVEYLGERPTAAFPSSHVGIVLILILLAWPAHKRAYIWLMPFFLLLSLSAIYIKAHYGVDIIGGIISAPLILWISKFFERLLMNKKSVKY